MTTIMSLPHTVNCLLLSSLSLFQPLSHDFLFFPPLFTRMRPSRCDIFRFTSLRTTLGSQSQLCGSWMYNTCSVFVCVSLLIAISIFCPLYGCPSEQQWGKKISKCQRTMKNVLEICAWEILGQNIKYLWFDLNVELIFELLWPSLGWGWNK